ncbi:MAG: transposase [Candidatus Thiodubiliella endoseptemdiera]|uniref:Transposase n=1 Tax=Candidatus Thiodubiliella endoseptemdiera TaxID=2738886 RepID=A0A853F5G3_9GAMM|nr:transposase [Candidatus Thiodubiliella endoseptemdiera]
MREVWCIWLLLLIGIPRLFYHKNIQHNGFTVSDERTQRCFRKYPHQRYLIPIKAVNTPVRCTQATQKLGITISMDGKGRATDNICIERFWRSAKCERIYLNEYQTISELTTDVDDYIEFYNHQRFHETLKYKTNGCVSRKYKIESEKEEGFLGFAI